MTKAQTIKLSKYFLTVAVGLAGIVALSGMIATTPEASAQSDTCTITLQEQAFTAEINESVGPFVIDGTCTTASDYFTYGLWNRTDDTWIIGPTTQWVNSEGYMFSATTDHTFTSLGTKDIEARVSWDAAVSFTGWYADRDVGTVDVVPASGGGSGPDANDDGVPDRVCTQVGVETQIDVLSNDSGSGSLSIDGITDQANRGTAVVTTDEGYEVIRYTPSSTGDDSFSYQISDGSGSTDEATVYTNNTNGCGSVTAQVSGVPDASKANIEPEYDGSNLPALNGQDASLHGWNVELDETPQLFVINRSEIDSPEGYEVDPGIAWINKVVPMEDKTGQQNTAELGLSYSATPSVCNPPIPTVGVGEITTINSAGNDRVLITNSSSRPDLIDQCAVDTGRMHPNYTTALDSTADWIWQTPQAHAPSTNNGPDGTVAAFQQQFNVVDASKVSSAEIKYAADNYYALRVNGTLVDESTAATAPSSVAGYETVKTADITSLIEPSTNTIELEVTNEGVQHQESPGNPGAGIFRIEVDARNCRTVSANSAEISASVASSGGGTDGDSDSSSITFGNFTSGNEYVAELSYTSSASAQLIGDCSGGSTGCSAYATASGVSASTPPGSTDSETETFTETYGPSNNSSISKNFYINVYGSSGSTNIHGGSASASVSDIDLMICES